MSESQLCPRGCGLSLSYLTDRMGDPALPHNGPNGICAPARLDAVNGPPHYKAPNGLEAIDVIEGFDLGFNLGNAVKYVLRFGRKTRGKDAITDLRKAKWYIEREIERLSK